MSSKLDRSIKMNKMRNETSFNECIHKDKDCSKSISKAHSIQNKGILDKLSRLGDVMAIDFSKVSSDNGFRLREVGRGKASTFTGFCNTHDSDIFRPIEHCDYMENNKEQNFLFAYRSFGLSYYERYSAYKLIKASQKSKEYKSNHILEQKLALYDIQLKIVDKIKIIMNTNLDNKRYDRITTDLLIWPGEYGIAATSMFFISKDNEGNTINKTNGYMSPLFFTIFPQLGTTYVLIGYFTKDKWMYQFVKDQIVTSGVEEQKIIISNLIATYIENIFIAPEYWDNLPVNTKEKYYQICNSIIGGRKPITLTTYRNFNLFI